MKQDYPAQGIKALCRLFGKTRHAWYDRQWRQQDTGLKAEIVLQHVHQIRKTLPGTGTRKLLHVITPMLAEHDLGVGRDYLFDLMREKGLSIRRRKRRVVTTDSRHWMHKYANLIKDLRVDRPEQVWVSDITYIGMNRGWGYLSLITDAYSRKIMGYCFHKDLSAQGCVRALKMALDNRIYQEHLIHHSDRGSQYCSKEYVEVLLSSKIAISMTENGDPYENALAERVNGILKEEFSLHYSAMGFDETARKVAESIGAYNELRPHASCDYLTPEQAHLKGGPLRKRWKNKNLKNTEIPLV